MGEESWDSSPTGFLRANANRAGEAVRRLEVITRIVRAAASAVVGRVWEYIQSVVVQRVVEFQAAQHRSLFFAAEGPYWDVSSVRVLFF